MQDAFAGAHHDAPARKFAKWQRVGAAICRQNKNQAYAVGRFVNRPYGIDLRV